MRLVIELLNAPLTAGFLLGQKRDSIPISESGRLLWAPPAPHTFCAAATFTRQCLVVCSGQGTKVGRQWALGGLSPWHVMPFLGDPMGAPLTSPPHEEQPGQGVPPRGCVCEDLAGCLMHYLQDQVDTLTFQSQSLRDRARRFEEALRKNTEEQLEVP